MGSIATSAINVRSALRIDEHESDARGLVSAVAPTMPGATAATSPRASLSCSSMRKADLTLIALVAMEPICVRGALRCHWVRRIRACNSHSAHSTTADPSFDAARKIICACLSHLHTRAKLDLFAAALAQLLAIKA